MLGPLVADAHLGGARSWGLILAAQGVGAVLGGFVMIRFRPRRMLLVASLAVPAAAEIPFVFDTSSRDEVHPLIGATPAQAVADQAHQVWVNFITSGDPGWPAYDTASRTTGLLAETLHVADDPAADERVRWDGIR